MALSYDFKMRTVRALIHVACCSAWGVSIPSAQAAPSGGEVVGGAGSITQTGVNTAIHQNTQNMAINWQSYNVNANERVQYIQPNASSLSLNRILSNQGSTIAGRIDANGHVILVNPNGILFTPTSVLNVGGLIASGLDIQPSDFLNGHYIFNEVLGTEGSVVNSGLINASLGGNMALMGRHVENNGVIAANLGTVTLAAGKEAVLTFDDAGLLGVRVSKEIVQSELGVDAAVINSGEIQAHGGRVLLTASTSQDVFSRAVNTDGLNEATSVVVHADGSFTLGDGADVVNSGTIDASASDQDIGRIVLIGENVTSSGTLRADTATGNGGEIELHANDTVLLTQSSVTSARAESNGHGGIVKVLGDKVGLFDQAAIDASGADGGGQVLIGGDRQGTNPQVRNANFIYLSNQSQVDANAYDHGDGGKIITVAEDTARIYGNLSARGGTNGGNGGFIETSGLKHFEITSVPDVSAVAGIGGTWLIDPYDLTISNVDDTAGCANINSTTSGCSGLSSPFSSSGAGAILDVSLIANALTSGNVSILTGAGLGNGDITLNSSADLSYNNVGTGGTTLTLNAAGKITCEAGSSIYDGGASTIDKLNVVLLAGGAVTLEGASGSNLAASITTQGGNFQVGSASAPVASFINNGTVNTSGAFNQDGGDIRIDATGAVTSTALDARGGNTGTSANNATDRAGKAGGNVTFNAGSIAVSGSINTSGSAGTYDTNGSGNNGQNGGNGGFVDLTASSGNIAVGAIHTSGGAAAGDYTDATDTGNGGDAGYIKLTVSGASAVTLNGDLTATGARGYIAGTAGSHGSGGDIDLNGPVILASTVTLDASGATDATVPVPGPSGNVSFNGELNATTAGVEGIDIKGQDVTFAQAIGNDQRLGALTVNAARNIRLSGHVTSGPMSMNFGQATAGVFTVAPNLNFLTGTMTVTGGTNVDAFNLGSVFTGTVNGGAGTGTDTLTAPNGGPHAWSITSEGGGRLGMSLTFTGMENLTGGDGDDGFTFDAGGAITGTVSGGAGNNTLTGRNAGNTWTISGANTGTVSAAGQYVSFNNIQNLIGGSANDDFNFTRSTSAITGTVDGGAHSTRDTVDLAALNTVNVTLGDGRFVGIERFIGNNINSTLSAEHTPNTWNITGANDGTVNGTAFVDFTRPVGGSGDDRFIFGSSGSLSGALDGGTQASQDTVDLSAWSTVNLVLGSGSYINIERFIGNNTQSTLTAPSMANTTNQWSITTENTGSVETTDSTNTVIASTQFEKFNHLTGGAVDDGFTLAGTVTGMIDGAGGSDILTITAAGNQVVEIIGDGRAPSASTTLRVNRLEDIRANAAANNTLIGDNSVDTANTWTLAVGRTGSVNSTRFSGFALLHGGTGDDIFNFQVTPVAANVLIDGAGHTSGDAVDLSALTSDPLTVQLGNTGFANIERIVGNNSASTLIGESRAGTANRWTISGANAGSVSVLDAGANVIATTAFVNFNNLTGGSVDDAFVMQTAGSLTGLISGGVHTRGDTLDLSAQAMINIDLTQTHQFTQIERFIGNDTDSTLFAGDGSNTWSINGANAGTVNSFAFENFNHLTGGGADDTFTITPSGSLSGQLQGGAGNDMLTIQTSTALVHLGIDPAAETNPYLNVDQIETITATGANNTLVGANLANAWTINTANSGNVNGMVFNNFATLIGGSDTDDFIFQNDGSFGIGRVGSVTGGGGHNTLRVDSAMANDDVFHLGNASGVNYVDINNTGPMRLFNLNEIGLYGRGGTDTIILDSDFDLTGGALTLSAETIANNASDTAAPLLSADRLVLAGINGTGTATNRLHTNINTLSIDAGGPVYVQETDHVTLDQLNAANSVDITAGGMIDGTAPLTVGAALTLATTGDIKLTGMNQLSGPLALAANNIVLRNTLATQFGDVSAANLDILSGGDITATGIMQVTGTASLNASGNAITLNGNHDFGTVLLTNASTATLNDVNDLTLGTDITGTLTVTSTGLNLNSVSAAEIDLDAGTGQIADNNGDETNLTAPAIKLRAGTGIGAGNAIETRTASISAENGAGEMSLANQGEVTINRLKNSGNININNTGGNILLLADNTQGSASPVNIDAGYTTGTVTITGNGALLGSPEDYFIVPDITAQNLTVNLSREFGSQARPVSVHVQDTFTVIARTAFYHYWGRIEPKRFIDKTILGAFAVNSAFGLNTQQLIIVESLASIDPAIFTDVKNFYYAETAILMPDDQRYEDEDDEYWKKRRM